jgi:hypothetical protein
MGGIFHKASEVVIWLGAEAENSDLAFDAFEMLPKIESIHWDPMANSILDEVLCGHKYALAVNKIFERSWWHRLWTVQESILGQTIIFVCGARQISGETLFAVQKCYFKHILYCCSSLQSKPSFIHMDLYSQPMSILELLFMSRFYKGSYTISSLLAYYRSRRCTDPRDKVYGLLGLAESEETNIIIPDYSSPISTIYEQTTLKLIEHSKSLQIFSHISARSMKIDEIATTGLPSWVPNWTSEGSHQQFVALSNRLDDIEDYKVSGGSSAHVKVVAKGKIALRGILLGSCGRLSEPNDSKRAYHFDVFKGWRDLVAKKLRLLYPNTICTSYSDAYWQTLCASKVIPVTTSDHDSMRTSDDSIERFWHDSWWSLYQESLHDADLGGEQQHNYEVRKLERIKFRQSIAAATTMRRLFISREDELLGLAPMDAQVGDMIALLEGGNVPYILRPKIGTGNEWEMIGDAYVHGIMDGEAWKPDQLVDIVLV